MSSVHILEQTVLVEVLVGGRYGNRRRADADHLVLGDGDV
jgi:hypothetical protein